jgi:hypothetical protein
MCIRDSFSGSDLAGKQVTIKFVRSVPTNSTLFNGKNSNVIVANNTIGTTMFPNIFVVDAVEDLNATFNYTLGPGDIYFRLDFGDCIRNVKVNTESN